MYPNWSPYSYTYNNPINWTDSTGMCPDGDCPDDKPENWDKGERLEEVTVVAESNSLWDNIVDFFSGWNLEGNSREGIKGGGGTEGYGSGNEDRGRTNGKANMDPTDFSEFITPGSVTKGVSTKMGPFLEASSYITTQWGYGESLGDAIIPFQGSDKNRTDQNLLSEDQMQEIKLRQIKLSNPIYLDRADGVDTIEFYPTVRTSDFKKTNDSIKRLNNTTRHNFKTWKKHLEKIN